MNRASSCGLVLMALTFAATVSESLAAPVECRARTCGDWTQENVRAAVDALVTTSRSGHVRQWEEHAGAVK